MCAPAFTYRLAENDDEGVSLYRDEGDRIAASLGSTPAMSLRNHGLLTAGRTVAEAFLWLYRLERAAQVQIDAGSAGTLSVMGGNIAKKSGDDVHAFAAIEDGYGELEFAALIRRMDRIDPGFIERHNLSYREQRGGPFTSRVGKRSRRASRSLRD